MIDHLGMLSGSLPAPAKAASDPEEGPEKLFAKVLAQQLRSAMPEEALGGEWGDAFGPLLDDLLAAEIEQKLKATSGSVSRPAPGPVRPMRAYGHGHGAGHGHGKVGKVTSAYGSRIHPVTGERAVHHGVDLGAPRGTPIQVGRAGVVVRAERAGAYGNLVEVDHGDGVTTRYAHCDRLDVRPGDTVEAGEQLGTVGSTGRSTGPHLHFEVRIEGEAVNPQESSWNDLFPQLSSGGVR